MTTPAIAPLQQRRLSERSVGGHCADACKSREAPKRSLRPGQVPVCKLLALCVFADLAL